MCYPVCGMIYIKEPLLPSSFMVLLFVLVSAPRLEYQRPCYVAIQQYDIVAKWCRAPSWCKTDLSSISKAEGMVLFNDALNTFYLRLYGVRHMVKDHLDKGRKPATAIWATLLDQQQGLFYTHHLTDRIIHATAFVTISREGRKKRFYLTTHSTHFVYVYLTSSLW